ncbi:MAG: hypothetical protein NW226_04815 [Microscillaceae bacterium]|nr:hypothetical protein [Microscillaceae bacterium]
MHNKPNVLCFCFICMVCMIQAQPIKLHPKNPHYLQYKGKPILLISSAEHYGAVINTDFDYKKYLQTMKKEGMNYTRIFTGSYVEIPGSFGIENNTLAPNTGSFLAPWKRTEEPGLYPGENKFDLNQWESRYFERLKDFMKEAQQLDIIVELTFFCATYQDSYWERHPFNPGNTINGLTQTDRKKSNTAENGLLTKYQKALVEKIARELNEFDNLFYEIQNEPWSDDPKDAIRTLKTVNITVQDWIKWAHTASQASLEWQESIAKHLADTEQQLPKKHLIAQNYVNFKHAIPEVSPHVDILNFHYAWPEAVWMNYGWNKPINFDESGFSDSGDTTYLQQAWQFMLAGGAIFNNLDYSFTVGSENGKAKNKAPGGGSTYFREKLTFLKKFLEGFDFIRMQPDLHLIAHAPGLEWQALAEAGKQYAIFFAGPKSSWAKIKLPAGTYTYSFFDPFSGQFISEGTVEGGKQTANIDFPAFSEMIALKLLLKK